MKFKYQFLTQIYKESMTCEFSKDPHIRLNTFERKLRVYLNNVRLDPSFLQEAAKVLMLINKTQDHLTEKLCHLDLDGDGVIGPVGESYEVATELGIIKEYY